MASLAERDQKARMLTLTLLVKLLANFSMLEIMKISEILGLLGKGIETVAGCICVYRSRFLPNLLNIEASVT